MNAPAPEMDGPRFDVEEFVKQVGLKAMLPRTKIVLFPMHMDSVPRSLAAAIGVDLALSKSDGITKLSEHLKMLLARVDGGDEIPKAETPQFISSKPA